MKTIEIKFYAEINNNHVIYKDIENFLLNNFQNYCDVKRVDLLEYKEVNEQNEVTYYDEYDMDVDCIPF